MRMIGDDNGPNYFNFDPANGLVSVKSNLRFDPNSFYRVRFINSLFIEFWNKLFILANM